MSSILFFSFLFDKHVNPLVYFIYQAKKVVSNGSAVAPATPVEAKKSSAAPVSQPKPSPVKAAPKKTDSPNKVAAAVKVLEQPQVAPKAEKKGVKQPQVKEPKPADFDEGKQMQCAHLLNYFTHLFLQ